MSFANDKGLDYVEISAKDSINVNDLFESIVEEPISKEKES